MVGGKAHVGEHVGLGLVLKAESLGRLDLSCSAILRRRALAASVPYWAKAVAMNAATTRRLLLPAWARDRPQAARLLRR